MSRKSTSKYRKAQAQARAEAHEQFLNDVPRERATEQTIEMLPVNELRLADYQRETKQKRAAAIASKFDVAKLGMLVVSRRDGQLFLIDGQHRAAALKMVGYSHTSCIVLHGLTYEQEAEYFSTQRENTSPLSQFSLFKAGIEAQDPVCIAIQEIAQKHGFEIRATSRDFKYISAIHALKTVIAAYGHDVLDSTLRLIKETWHGDKNTTKREYIVGVADFVNRFGEASFVKRMQQANLSALWREYLKNATFYSRASSDPAMRKAFCLAILTEYNKGLKASKRFVLEG